MGKSMNRKHVVRAIRCLHTPPAMRTTAPEKQPVAGSLNPCYVGKALIQFSCV